ncbi:MAG: carbohydrate-binding family 9-like protein [Pyrinomonadaceae bacterium]
MIINSIYQTTDIELCDLTAPVWRDGGAAKLNKYWSGIDAPLVRHSEVRSLWNDAAVYFRFFCEQDGPMVVNAEPRLDVKTIGLWDRDVCEVFVAPDLAQPDRYFEFEAAPTGEWLDLGIQVTPEGRMTDWDFLSGMTVANWIELHCVVIGMRIPWGAFGTHPIPGDRWRVNFFRCVGSGEDRGYLAWQPTHTQKPNFHVPEAFGELVFIE